MGLVTGTIGLVALQSRRLVVLSYSMVGASQRGEHRTNVDHGGDIGEVLPESCDPFSGPGERVDAVGSLGASKVIAGVGTPAPSIVVLMGLATVVGGGPQAQGQKKGGDGQ